MSRKATVTEEEGFSESNQKLVELFEDLAYYQDENHENKLVLQEIYLNAANLISISNKVIKVNTKIRDPLMSKGVYDKIKEYLTTGKCKELIKFQKKYDPDFIEKVENVIYQPEPKTIFLFDILKSSETPQVEVISALNSNKKLTVQEKIEVLNPEDKEIIDYFSSFYGIGPVKALKLFNLGYRTLEQLWDDRDKVLTKAQQDGIIWRNHIPVRIPRDEMFLIYDIISSIFHTDDITFDIAGSFRRKETSSGDIDLLIMKKEGLYMDIIIDLLSDYLPVIFTKGELKSSGMFRLSEDFYGHRIDILLIEEESWPLALLYFTGSATFNPLIREHARKLGYKLNEYNLVKYLPNDNEEIIKIETEKDVFDELELQYLFPQERTNDLKELQPKIIKPIISKPIQITNQNITPVVVRKQPIVFKKQVPPPFPKFSNQVRK